MQVLIHRWAMNGWTVKNISQFSHSEGQLGELGFQHSSYSTILFEKEGASLCSICNKPVNDMKLHTEWHSKERGPPPKPCTKCAREVNTSASYCPNCGNQLSKS